MSAQRVRKMNGPSPGEPLSQYDVSTREGVMRCYEATFDEVYARAVRLTRGDRSAAEDLTHETFTRLVRASRRGDMTTIGFGWLVTTLRRLFIDRYRSGEREQVRLRVVHNEPSGVAYPSPDARAASHDLLVGLPGDQAAVLTLRFVDDLAVSEIARLMDRSVRATESLLRRAIEHARRNLETTNFGDAS